MPYIGNTPADKFLTLAKQSFSTSATTSYTLDSAVSSTQDIALFINSVRQSPVDAYSVSGTALTLTSATAGTDEMYCVYLGKTVGTVSPSINSITNAMMTDDSVGLAELSATGTPSSSNFLRGDNAWATAGGNNTPAFFVRNSANQDVSHGVETLVTWGTEILDTDNAFASNKFTPQESGKYFIAFQLGGADDTNTSSNLAYLMLKIRKNGSGYQSQGIFNLNNNQGRQATYSIQAIVDLNGSSDYVDFSAEVGTADSTTGRFMDDYARASGFKLIGA